MTGNSASSLVRYPDIAILRPGIGRGVQMIVACLGLFAIGWWMIRSGEAIGWFLLVFFGLATLVAAAQILPGASGLVVMKEGFAVRVLFRTRFYDWNQIDLIGVFVVSGRRGRRGEKKVGFNVPKKRSKIGEVMFMPLSGYSHALPECYGYDAHELAAALNHYRNDAIAAIAAQPTATQDLPQNAR